MTTKPLPDARTTAYRALCLGALYKRMELEHAALRLNNSDMPQDVRRFALSRHWTENQRLLRWIYDEKLEPHFTRAERTLFAQAYSTWPEAALDEKHWCSETLGMLLWALHVVETIPPFDTPFTHETLLTPLDLYTPVIDFLWQAQLRSAGELRSMRDQADLWNWRSQLAELAQLGIRPQGRLSFGAIIRETAEKAHQDRYLPAPIDGDFPAFGRAYADLTREQSRIVAHIAQERSAALDWLCAGVQTRSPVDTPR